jgi:cytochrome c-type biogenesis protein CcmH/NrfG
MEHEMSLMKNESSTDRWTSIQAYTLAVICLLLGVAGGWFIRGSQSPTAAAGLQSAGAQNFGAMPSSTETQPSPDQLKKMAETQAVPLLERLKSEPNNPELLANIGNIYYDAQQYPAAIDFYQRALRAQPANAGVRTDMATAYWYSGNADSAITEFNKALIYQPNNANTLFNLGIVKWQGKMDVEGAVAVWQKLLATNPNYENKEKVLQLISQAQTHANLKPGTPPKSQSE